MLTSQYFILEVYLNITVSSIKSNLVTISKLYLPSLCLTLNIYVLNVERTRGTRAYRNLQICGKEIVTVRTALKNKVQLKKSLKILK